MEEIIVKRTDEWLYHHVSVFSSKWNETLQAHVSGLVDEDTFVFRGNADKWLREVIYGYLKNCDLIKEV